MLGGTGIQISNQNTGGAGQVDSVGAGTNVTVDNTDPVNPIVNVPNVGVVDAVVAGTNVTVDNTDPVNPIVNVPNVGVVDAVVAGTNVTVDNTDPVNPIVNVSNVGVVDAVVAGTNVTVDNTDPANPIVGVTPALGTAAAAAIGDFDPAGAAAAAQAAAQAYADSLAPDYDPAGAAAAAQSAAQSFATNADLAKLNITGDPTTLADLAYDGRTITLVAGENLVAGDVVYVKSDGKMGKGDADAAATSGVTFIALATILNNASGLFGRPDGIYRNDALYAWATIGAKLYLSTAAGALTDVIPSGSGDQVQPCGVVMSADIIHFLPTLATVEIA